MRCSDRCGGRAWEAKHPRLRGGRKGPIARPGRVAHRVPEKGKEMTKVEVEALWRGRNGSAACARSG